MFALIGTALAALLAIVAVRAALKPNVFNVARETTIDVPPEQIFPFINNFHNWIDWSPYEKLDPAMVRLFSGPEEGTGAVYAWNSQGARERAG